MYSYTDNPIPTAAPLTLPIKIIQPITPELKPTINGEEGKMVCDCQNN
jgi:hypothetical protein